MKGVIIRNLERLIDYEPDQEREPIEPMTEWKWKRLCLLADKFDITPWIIDGVRAYQDDFFMQMPQHLQDELLLNNGMKDEENLRRFQLYADRSQGWRHKLSRTSLQAYASDFIQAVTNIEE